MNFFWMLIFVLPSQAAGGTMPVLAEMGETGPHNRLIMDGNLAYIAAFSGVHIYDVSNPDTPANVNYFETEGGALDLAMSGTNLLVGDTNGLLIVDVSNPFMPQELSRWIPPAADSHSINLLRISGQYVFLVDFGVLRVVDIADPANPTTVGAYDTGVIIYGMDLSGSNAYLTTADNEILCLDVSNPATPTLQKTVAPGFFPLGIAMNGSIAYVGDLSTANLAVWDLAPATPVELGRLSVSPGVPLWKFVLDGTLLYVPLNGAGVSIIDVSTAATPTLVGNLPADDLSRDVAVSGGIACVAVFTEGTQVVDISTPSAPQVRGILGSGNLAERLIKDGDRVYRVDQGLSGGNLLQVTDLSDPLNPLDLGTYATVDIRDLAVSGNHVVTAENTAGLKLIDVGDGNNPTLTGTFAGTFTGVATIGNHALAVGTNQLTVVDISNPAAPALVTELGLSTPRGIRLQGSLAYIGDRSRGLVIVDVSNPAKPVNISELRATIPGVSDVRVYGDLAFMPYLGLEVVDVSDPVKPVSVAFFDGPFVDVLYDQGLLYASLQVEDLAVYELTDMFELNLLHTFFSPGVAGPLLREPGRIFLSDGAGGIHYIIADTLRYPRLLQNWPVTNVGELIAHWEGQAGR